MRRTREEEAAAGAAGKRRRLRLELEPEAVPPGQLVGDAWLEIALNVATPRDLSRLEIAWRWAGRDDQPNFTDAWRGLFARVHRSPFSGEPQHRTRNALRYARLRPPDDPLRYWKLVTANADMWVRTQLDYRAYIWPHRMPEIIDVFNWMHRAHGPPALRSPGYIGPDDRYLGVSNSVATARWRVTPGGVCALRSDYALETFTVPLTDASGDRVLRLTLERVDLGPDELILLPASEGTELMFATVDSDRPALELSIGMRHTMRTDTHADFFNILVHRIDLDALVHVSIGQMPRFAGRGWHTDNPRVRATRQLSALLRDLAQVPVAPEGPEATHHALVGTWDDFFGRDLDALSDANFVALGDALFRDPAPAMPVRTPDAVTWDDAGFPFAAQLVRAVARFIGPGAYPTFTAPH